MAGLHAGVADHLGWAVVVTVAAAGRVVDRRRIALVEPGFPVAPVHHGGGAHALHRRTEPPTDGELAALVDQVRDAATRATRAALGDLARTCAGALRSVSLRHWPADFPADIATQRRVPYESRADPIMYRTVLADVVRANGWDVRVFDARRVEDDAAALFGTGGHAVLAALRAELGPPWTADHRLAYAAAIVAAGPAAPTSRSGA